MNNRLLISLGCVSALLMQPAHAGHNERQDFAKVVSATPIYEQISFSRPQTECWVESVAYERERERRNNSATPTLLGAVIGGAIGHAIGKHDRRSGTAIGAVLGGSIGHDMGKSGGPRSVEYRDEERCETRQIKQFEDRLAGYNVTYRYHGDTYTTRMDREPGAKIRVAVSVTPIE